IAGVDDVSRRDRLGRGRGLCARGPSLIAPLQRVAGGLTHAEYLMKSAGPCALLTASISFSTVVCRGSNVTIASWFSRLTIARETPLTSSSADRTALIHPSHIIPSTMRVTVDSAA